MEAINFDKMLIEMRDPLYYFSSRFYHSEDDRMDLVQETMTKAFYYKEKFSMGTNFKAWVFTIMKNTFINEYKKTQKRKESTSSEDIYENARNFVEHETPHHILQKSEFDDKVSSLDSKFSDPLQRYHEGYKYEEIAAEMELPLGTVKNRIHTARQILVNVYK
jgi:RNA polymerase sigma-70 factor, ECF subfamily